VTTPAPQRGWDQSQNSGGFKTKSLPEWRGWVGKKVTITINKSAPGLPAAITAVVSKKGKRFAINPVGEAQRMLRAVCAQHRKPGVRYSPVPVTIIDLRRASNDRREAD
jgi:hypothetical protein